MLVFPPSLPSFPSGPSRVFVLHSEFVEKADDQLWIISLIAKVIVIALNPLTW